MLQETCVQKSKLMNPGVRCQNCLSTDNESGAKYCMTCGERLGSSLTLPPEPRPGINLPAHISPEVCLNSVLWSAATYTAYAATRSGTGPSSCLVIQRSKSLPDPLSKLLAGSDSAESDKSAKFADIAEAFEKFGLLRPSERISAPESTFLMYDDIHVQPLAYLDQMSEKETRSVGLQLCELAARFHQMGWVFNGFDPYNVVIDGDNKARLIGLERARAAGSSVSAAPIFPTRGYTGPELFYPKASYEPTADIYSIGALLQSLVTGERLESGEASAIYPIATIAPAFERLLYKALDDNPMLRFQSAPELKHSLTAVSLPITLQSGHYTDVGLVRELNEDSILTMNLTQYYESVQTQIGLYIVSDGMGGEAAGEIASRVTVRSVAECITDKLISASLKSTHKEKIAAPTTTGGLRLAVADGNDMRTTEMLKEAVLKANREVLDYSHNHPDESGLGATVTTAMIVGDVLTIAHVGDSRCYILSGDRLEQITEDHSLVQRMINTGNLSRLEARIHPYRNVIYRSIGGDEEIEIDIIRRRISGGDVILLCSDGLTGMLSDDQIRDILMVNPDPNTAAKELVVNANSAGGEDNTSVVVVRVS